MQKPGGIIALIGGIFGTIAALFTLLAGGFVAGLEGASASLSDTAVDTTASTQIAGFGAMGLLFSFLTIIFAAIAMNAKSKVPGLILIVCAIIGAVTGGTFVAVCMVLTLAGGILATIGAKPVPKSEEM
jgi:hypothetical protein|tara:strand:- start:155 stop:541 length:387 start_codon:yes stop_codon:yes gene_type:complete